MTLPNGYVMKTTFFEDFSIADVFGIRAVRDTFSSAFRSWKDNIEYVTELAVTLNLKCWEHYEKGNEKLSELYSGYFYKVQDYVYDHFDGKDIEHYFKVTD